MERCKLQSSLKDVENFKLQRYLPKRQLVSVGPIVFCEVIEGHSTNQDHANLQPYAGIEMFNYLLSGSLKINTSVSASFNLVNNYGYYLNSANGVLVREAMTNHFENDFKYLKFWIKPTALETQKQAKLIKLPAINIPKYTFNNLTFTMLLGEFYYERLLSSHHNSLANATIFIVDIKPNTHAKLLMDKIDEYAVLPLDFSIIVNNANCITKGEAFVTHEQELEILNPNLSEIKVLVFGGKALPESIYYHNGIVLNEQSQLHQVKTNLKNRSLYK